MWKLGIEGVRPAQEPNGPVGRLWVVSASPVSTGGHLDGCAPRPAVVHLLSPGCPCWIPRPPRAVPGSPSWEPPSVVPRPRELGIFAVQSGFWGRGPGSCDATRSPEVRRSVTCRDLVATRSPQPVHIPGDNFSTSRPRSPIAYPVLPASTRGSPLSTSVHGCGQPSGEEMTTGRSVRPSGGRAAGDGTGGSARLSGARRVRKPGTAPVGPSGPGGSAQARLSGSSCWGDGNWPRCRPEDDSVTAGRGF